MPQANHCMVLAAFFVVFVSVCVFSLRFKLSLFVIVIVFRYRFSFPLLPLPLQKIKHYVSYTHLRRTQCR